MNDLFTGKSKEEIAIERIKTFCPEEGYYLAYSGGKDSIVVRDLLIKSECKYDGHFSYTTVDPPEIISFIKQFKDISIDRPTTSMWKLIIKNRVPPTMKYRYCCAELKETGGINRRVITGIRWKESTRRQKRKMVEACFKDSRKFYVHPIIDWSDGDVWDYIKNNNLPYPSLYDEGFDRVGCIGCPQGRHDRMIRDFERWPQYKKAYINTFNKCLEKRKLDGLKSTRWANGQDMFDWWINDNKRKVNPDQTVMFE